MVPAMVPAEQEHQEEENLHPAHEEKEEGDEEEETWLNLSGCIGDAPNPGFMDPGAITAVLEQAKAAEDTRPGIGVLTSKQETSQAKPQAVVSLYGEFIGPLPVPSVAPVESLYADLFTTAGRPRSGSASTTALQSSGSSLGDLFGPPVPVTSPAAISLGKLFDEEGAPCPVVERREHPESGGLYTKGELVDQFGGTDEWNHSTVHRFVAPQHETATVSPTATSFYDSILADTSLATTEGKDGSSSPLFSAETPVSHLQRTHQAPDEEMELFMQRTAAAAEAAAALMASDAADAAKAEAARRSFAEMQAAEEHNAVAVLQARVRGNLVRRRQQQALEEPEISPRTGQATTEPVLATATQSGQLQPGMSDPVSLLRSRPDPAKLATAEEVNRKAALQDQAARAPAEEQQYAAAIKDIENQLAELAAIEAAMEADTEAIAVAATKKEAADARQREQKRVIAVQIQEQMQSGQIFADDNLSAWFPSATEREIEAALQQVRGHAGRARKLLRLQHADMGVPSTLALGKRQSQSSSSELSIPPLREQKRRESSPFAAETSPVGSSARAAELAMQKRTRLRQEAVEREKRRRQSAKAADGGPTAGTDAARATVSVANEEERARLRQEALSREKARRAALMQAEISSRASEQLSVDDMAAILRAARGSSNCGSTSTRPTTGMRSPSSSSSVEPPPSSPHRDRSSQREAERFSRRKTGTNAHLQQQASPQNGVVRPSKGAFSEAVPPPPGLGGRSFKRTPPVPKHGAARRKQPQQQTEAFKPRGSSV